MYAFFGLSGLVALAGWAARKLAREHDRARAIAAASADEEEAAVPGAAVAVARAVGAQVSTLTRRVELVFVGLAFGHGAFQMALHAQSGLSGHKAPPFFELLHTLQSAVMLLGAMAAWVEAWHTDPEDAQIAALLRAFFVLLTGAWQFHMAEYYREPMIWIEQKGSHGTSGLMVVFAAISIAIALAMLTLAGLFAYLRFAGHCSSLAGPSDAFETGVPRSGDRGAAWIAKRAWYDRVALADELQACTELGTGAEGSPATELGACTRTEGPK
jgi:hypothetical protein